MYNIFTPLPAKFFDMPKGTKPAPPQQANLQEMWGKNKSKVTKVEQEQPVDLQEGPSTRPESHHLMNTHDQQVRVQSGNSLLVHQTVSHDRGLPSSSSYYVS